MLNQPQDALIEFYNALRFKSHHLLASRAVEVWRFYLDQQTFPTLPELKNTATKLKTRFRHHACNNGPEAFIIPGIKLQENGQISNPLKARLSNALPFLRQTQNAHVILTGGLAKAGISEAKAMQRFLVDHGIEKERLYLESYATNTIENMQFSLPLLKSLAVKDVSILSDPLHAIRAASTLQTLAPELDVSVSGSIPPFNQGCPQWRNVYIDWLRAAGNPCFHIGNYVYY